MITYRTTPAIIATGLLVTLAGCTSVSKTVPAVQVSLEALSTDATYDIIGPAEGVASDKYIFGIRMPLFKSRTETGAMIGSAHSLHGGGPLSGYRPDPASVTKGQALYNAIESVPEADGLLAPRWHVETRGGFIVRSVTARVKGKAIRLNAAKNE